MRIEEAAATDAEAVVGLWRSAGLTRPWNDPVADCRRALDWPGSTLLVAREGGATVGTIMVGYDGHRGWIYYLAVVPARRRTGIGRALVEAAQAWLAERGCPKIQLMVRDDNAAAIAFYRALGLDVQGVVTLGRFLERDQL
jgi:ribosomal protein S18 acetylase RimI-like enzyme